MSHGNCNCRMGAMKIEMEIVKVWEPTTGFRLEGVSSDWHGPPFVRMSGLLCGIREKCDDSRTKSFDVTDDRKLTGQDSCSAGSIYVMVMSDDLINDDDGG